MELIIKKIVLWPKITELEPRVIPFKPNKVNIISGQSATGKSSLTSIIDYCLGSGKCTIPVGLIRDVTEWFGLHIELLNTELIVARKNPGEKQSTTDLFWLEGRDLKLPKHIEKNARLDDLKNRLNQAAQLPLLELSAEEKIGFGSRPSFRDMSAFNFQPQHIVANPYTLFYKAYTNEHREKLKAVFPLVLGAINASTLQKQRELKDLTREHDKLNRELEARLDAARSWETEIESYFLQAKSYGLLPQSGEPNSSWDMDRYLLELSPLPKMVANQDLPLIKQGTSEDAAAKITEIVELEDELAQRIGIAKRRLSQLNNLLSSMTEYGSTLNDQKDRMLGVGWLEKKISNSNKCPVCSASHKQGKSELETLKTLAKELSTLTSSIAQAPAKLDQEQADVKSELRELESEISKVRQKRQALESESRELSAHRQKVRQIYLFVGRIEQAVENATSSQKLSEIKEKVSALASMVAKLKGELNPIAQEMREDAAIDSISRRIHYYARELELEHASENVRLNTKELSLQFTTLSGRKDFLWEVGSGQNWVGYHISCILALHEHFKGLDGSPVPSFLVLDQPSQVYFPEAWPSVDDSSISKSADIEGVHRIFSALSSFLKVVPTPFQIIVSEHAGEITWEGLENIHLVGNWRDGFDDFLIPKSWIEKHQ